MGAKKLKAVYEGIFKSRPAVAWEDLLGHDLCCIKVRTIEEWLGDSMEAGMSDACRLEDPELQMELELALALLDESGVIVFSGDEGPGELLAVFTSFLFTHNAQIGILAFSLGTIIVKTLRAVLANPVDSLHYE